MKYYWWLALPALAACGMASKTPDPVMAEQCVRLGGSWEFPATNSQFRACVVHRDSVLALPKPVEPEPASPPPAERVTSDTVAPPPYVAVP